MFLGLAIICDDYFVASLEQIVEVSILNLLIVSILNLLKNMK